MKKKIFRSGLLILIMLPAVAIAHFIAFPQETRCMLICFANFDRKGDLYFRHDTDPNLVEKIQQTELIAEEKAKRFWGTNYLPAHKIIFCNTEKDFAAYGRTGFPATIQRKSGAYLVLKNESLDSSIIAHELSHGILYNNIGWYKTTFKIPLWFDEGLAMQVDDRDYYSVDTLISKIKAGIALPDVRSFKKAGDFFAGDSEAIMLNYAASKYVVHEWLKTHSLKIFIAHINSGEPFDAAYDEKN